MMRKRNAKKMQIIGSPHSSTAGSFAAGKGRVKRRKTNQFSFLLSEQKLQAHTLNGIALNGSITSADDSGRWKSPIHPVGEKAFSLSDTKPL